ncbi:N-methylhydantoinase B (plasmid) [Haloarcula marismortui ATCC 43049]|uniref:Hydantoinase B/oxoprolinase family protein n=1 Tax=Haloarcula marismortui (strain ATCC 43049 / DSM 3752 / JCM 8966 / VKM B-1809) TaxID=272569 RepID=Q5V6I1_HALMA|nr:hydantoinase B/oxoprolinase family protein [Haloarcula marismortui]AAV44871.1 N-methylhydantoinase B [Haloarcula marismortui ATCC 43049]QCP90180.1 hydantoinase B/oxoprolinase family protein [Haloarcula marismortui ATCC 43049]
MNDEATTSSDGQETIDPVTLEILRNQLESVATEMGHVLIRGAYSPNIKERQDCSTALFDASGRMVAQAEHIPVHLGAMPDAVDIVLEKDPKPGDVFIVNDPFAGGTHLPDITLVSTIAPNDEVIGYAVSRAHHADVGGSSPGSMPPGAQEIYEEGLRLPAVRLVDGGEPNEAVHDLIRANVRTPDEREADLRAQRAANARAEERIGELLEEHGPTLLDAFNAVIEYSRERVKAELDALPDGTYRAKDILEGDGVTDTDIPIDVAVTIDGASIAVDFTGTADQVAGNLNAPLSVAKSAVYFVVRAITDPEIPPNHGCYEPVSVSAPEGSVLNPNPPAAVVGGNVETSQRVMDVTLAALATAVPDKVPAGGQGTMNNLIIGDRTGEFTYYETIGGGFGARPEKDGMDGVQVGMTNTLNTPVEAMETEYPLRVERYALRPSSGGDGRYRGGLGLERTVTVETDATVSLLTERRRTAPAGIAGGEDGTTGENLVDGEPVPAKASIDIEAGTTVSVRTPGGGGHGNPAERDPEARERDRRDGKADEG